MKTIEKLDLNLLKTFVVLMDECNVSRAAERLSLTQPAVSGMLNRLRESLNDPLFVRSQHGIVPTVRAKELASPIKKVLSELDTALQPPVFSPQTSALTFSMAGTDYSLSAIILPFIKTLNALAPDIRIATHFIRDDQIFQQMEKSLIDVAFMTPETAPGDLKGKVLFNEEYVCIMSVNHPLATQQQLTLDAFCNADHAIVSYQGGAFAGITDQVLKEKGLARKVAISVPSFLVLMELIQQTQLIAVAPKRLVTNNINIKTMELPITIPGFTKYMVWHESTHLSPAHQWIRQQLENCINLIDC
ncbi:LysR family transcriptional regulator [Alteromonas sp. AMM-1]|uniref:LysR family transcriptional regulator n=1 Tax=Alteromonas sp. AMM-1 TaxID=3394233 RepID=UPI0039A6E3E7